MSFLGAAKSYFVNCINFRSRASRSEYWWGILFVTLLSYLQGYVVSSVAVSAFSSPNAIDTYIKLGIAMLAIQVFHMVASTALTARRLHDVNMSGWWYLLAFTIIGLIPLSIWFCTKGTIGRNRFGKDPLEHQKHLFKPQVFRESRKAETKQ